jgi:uncharacterized caspase-like protein
LKSLRLYEDGELLRVQQLSGLEQSLEIGLPRLKSARWLTAVVEDVNGFLSQAAAQQIEQSAVERSRLLALAVGVDKYNDPHLGKLHFAGSDAATLGETLRLTAKPYYGADSITVWRDELAQPTKLKAKLSEMVDEAQPGDTIVFGYSSHGLRGSDGRYYLATTSTDVNRLEETALGWEDVASIISRAKTRVVVFLDACHAGATGNNLSATNDGAVDQLLKGTKAPILVFAASKGRQYSLEQSLLGGGVFTRAVRSALVDKRSETDRDANGFIEISELYTAVKGFVLDHTGGKQSPWLVRSDPVGDFSLF